MILNTYQHSQWFGLSVLYQTYHLHVGAETLWYNIQMYGLTEVLDTESRGENVSKELRK